MPVEALVDDCPLYDLEPERARASRSTRRRSGSLSLRRPGARSLLALLGSPNICSRRAAVRAVRLPWCSRAPCAGPSRPTPRCSSSPTTAREGAHRRLDRRQRPPRGLRSLLGHGRGGARVRRQPRLRRRRAARAHQLPELRQPREAARGLAAGALGGRDGRRARGARACPWWAATCRSTTSPATARSTRRRWSAWWARCPTRSAAAPIGLRRTRATRSPSAASSSPHLPGERAGEAARRAAARPSCPSVDLGARFARRRRPCATPCARATLARAPTTSPRAASWSRSPSRCLAGGIGATLDDLGRARSRCCAPLRRGPGRASWCRARARRSSALGRAHAARRVRHRRRRRRSP